MKFYSILFLALSLLLSGCASSGSDSTTSQTVSGDSNEKVSDIPWNRPQSWESNGQLGSALGH